MRIESWISALILGQLLSMAAEPQRFALAMPELCDRQFPGGGVIEVDVNTQIRRLEFRLPPPSAQRVRKGGARVRIGDRVAPLSQVAEEGSDLVITVEPPPDEELLPDKPEILIRAYIDGDTEHGQSWLLRRRKIPFIRQTVSDSNGISIEAVLESPAEKPMLLASQPSAEVTFKGTIGPMDHVKSFRIGQQIVPVDRTLRRQSFNVNEIVKRGVREVVLEAIDDVGFRAVIVVPIYQQGAGRKRN